MERRGFLQSGLASAALATLSPFVDVEEFVGQAVSTSSKTNTGGLDLLKKPYDPQIAALVYEEPKFAPPPCPPGEKCPAPALPPNGFLFYDKGSKTFVKPSTLEASKDKGNYAISATMKAFNISTDAYKIAQSSKQEVQIGLNFSAPITSAGDNFAWILKNAVNVFLGKTNDISGSLASFKAANPASPAASPTNKVQVLQGAFDLQVNAFFQKKDGWWRKLFQAFAGVPGAPLLATLGIPGVALSALDFVTYSLGKLTQDEPLVPLWDAQPLTFALTKGVERDFRFQDGLWCIVDRSVLKTTNYLKGFTVDIDGQSYQVIDSDGKSLNANYVVAQFDITST